VQNKTAMFRAALPVFVACFVQSSADTLEFHSADGERAVMPVTKEDGASLCLRKFEQPPYYAWPVMQVYLLLKLDDKEESPSTMSSVFSWISSVGQPEKLHLKVKTFRPPRWFCQLGYPWLPAILPGVCQDCTKKCSVKALQWAEHLAVPIPSEGGCVYISQLPSNVQTVHASWYLHFDFLVFLFLLVGIIFVVGWKPLRESVAFHAGLGGLSSLIFIAFMVFLWLSNRVQSNVPYGRSLTTVLAAAFALIPAARNALVSWTLRWLPAPNWQTWLGLKDPFLGLPIGWLAFLLLLVLCLVLVHLGAKLSVNYFAAQPEPEGEVDFVIGADGRRVDLLPPVPYSQRMLGWGIWLVGILCLLSSTHSDTCSVIITLVVTLKDYIEHAVCTLIMWRNVDVNPSDIRSLISSDEMHSQASASTRAALAQLQQYVKEHPHMVQTGRELTELRLRRFREDGVHFRQPMMPVVESAGSMCVLQ